jgi:hypothetical protein
MNTTKDEVNRMASVYGLQGKDFIIVPEDITIPGGEVRGPVRRAQAWYRCDEACFEFDHFTNAIPEEVLASPNTLKNQDYLSIQCCSAIGRTVGVLPTSYL